MEIKQLQKELEGIPVLRLRKIAHHIFGKGSWMATVRKPTMIKRIMACDPKEESRIEKIRNAIAASTGKAIRRSDKSIFTPRIKALLKQVSEAIDEEVQKRIATQNLKDWV